MSIPVLAGLVAALGAPAAFAESARPAHAPPSLFIIPTPQPAPMADYTFRPLALIPFAPTMPEVPARARADEAAAPANIVAEGAASAVRDDSPTTSDESAGEVSQVEADDAVDADPIDAPDGVLNVVLLGADKRPEQGDWRTDTIIVVSINLQAQSVGVLSIPRDLWVKIPDFGVGRINTVDFIGEWKDAEGGGSGLLKRTIEANLGIPIHRYARIDLEGFIQVIDALGGVWIDVDCPVNDAFLDGPLTGEDGLAPLNLEVGMHHLDGLTALRYARSRRFGTDFDRAQRQQKLLRSLAEQNLNWQIIPKLPGLWESLNGTVQTDLTLPELIQLASVGMQIQENRIKSRFIDWRTTENFVTAGGAQVLLPNQETLPRAVAEFLDPPEEDLRLMSEHARIEVKNGTSATGLAEVAAKRLVRAGFNVVSTTETAELHRSTIVVFGDTPLTLAAIQDVLHLNPVTVVHSPEPRDDVDLQIVLGNDWNPCP